jgi:hypothetical protein
VRQPTCYLQPLPPSGSYAFRVVDIPVPVLNSGGGGGGGAEELVRLGRGACALGREAGEGFRVLHQTTGSDCDEDSEEVGAAFVDSDAELKLDGTDSESCSDGEVCGRGTLLAQQQQPLQRVALDAGAQRQEEVRRIAGTIRDHWGFRGVGGGIEADLENIVWSGWRGNRSCCWMETKGMGSDSRSEEVRMGKGWAATKA